MYTRQTIEYYDVRAQRYFDEWKNNQLLMPLLKCLMSRLPSEPKLLDLGCGPGVESKRLADLGANVVGIDLSENSLKIARRHAPEATFMLMDRWMELVCSMGFSIVERPEFEDGNFRAALFTKE